MPPLDPRIHDIQAGGGTVDIWTGHPFPHVDVPPQTIYLRLARIPYCVPYREPEQIAIRVLGRRREIILHVPLDLEYVRDAHMEVLSTLRGLVGSSLFNHITSYQFRIIFAIARTLYYFAGGANAPWDATFLRRWNEFRRLAFCAARRSYLQPASNERLLMRFVRWADSWLADVLPPLSVAHDHPEETAGAEDELEGPEEALNGGAGGDDLDLVAEVIEGLAVISTTGITPDNNKLSNQTMLLNIVFWLNQLKDSTVDLSLQSQSTRLKKTVILHHHNSLLLNLLFYRSKKFFHLLKFFLSLSHLRLQILFLSLHLQTLPILH
ncbi:hypothetical protein C8T65DRAFT_744800 [Cerioporus squamosus]|nr:hypothetical protein C8T65DRAFT_744800 [Cerioporus squamosus]